MYPARAALYRLLDPLPDEFVQPSNLDEGLVYRASRGAGHGEPPVMYNII